MGARLFERHLGAFAPTETGAVAVASAERVELEVQAMMAAVSGQDRLAAGLVRVTAVPILVNHVLVPALPALRAAHPQLRVELVAEPRDLSLTRREADIAVRLARPQRDLRAFARRIGQLHYAVYGSKDRSENTLPWITYEDRMSDLPQWRWLADRLVEDGTAPAMTVNDAEAVLAGIRAGLGRSLLPVAIARKWADLAPEDPGPPVLSREIWLMVHPDLRHLTRVRVVMDWLAGLAATL